MNTIKGAELSKGGRKNRILQAAREIFSEKSLLGANISEIAQKADVAEAVIYQYFKGKEDLLFSVPEQFMGSLLKILELNLGGIRDAESLLGRFIWLQLHNSTTFPEDTRILLECRSQKDWYQSRAYGLVRKYGGYLLHILEMGVQSGRFRRNVDMRLVRDIIFGTMDFEDISYLVTKEISDPSADSDRIMALILPMIGRVGLPESTPLTKGDRILFAAEQIFAEKGFVKAKVADVAKQAGVAEGTVYEYFSSKDDLLLSISSRRLQDHIDQLEETFEIKSPLRKLRRMIRNHFSLYLTNRNFLKVFLLHIQFSPHFYDSKIYKTYSQYFHLIESTIEEGKSEGSFRSDVDTRVFRNLFLGAFSHLAIRWFILGKGPETDMMREIDQVTDLLSLSVLADQAREKSKIATELS